MDSDEEASSDKQVSSESGEPGPCLVNLENKPDLCLLSMGLVDRDRGCGRTPAIITCPESNNSSFNNVASTKHISSMSTINSSNKMPGVRNEQRKEEKSSYAVIYYSAKFPTQMLQSRRRKILDLYARACNVTEGAFQITSGGFLSFECSCAQPC